MAIAHFVVTYDTKTGEWGIDDETAIAKFDERLWYEEDGDDEGWRRPLDSDEEQEDANAYGVLSRAIESINKENTND